MENIASLLDTSSDSVGASAMPRAAAAESRLGAISNHVPLYPFLRRLGAIRLPMLPKPTQPI
jgi:hypothetical protein